jgi:hypothetical protein
MGNAPSTTTLPSSWMRARGWLASVISSPICPTISATASSRVTSPDVPPYSSHHQGDGDLGALELFEDLADGLGLGRDQDVPPQLGGLEAIPISEEQILHIDVAHDVIGVVVAGDWIAAEAPLLHRGAPPLDGPLEGEDLHVHSGDHDGAHRSVGGAEHALEELALLALFLADRGLDHEAQLLEGELAFRVIRGRHPQHRQHDLGADVEDDEGRVDRVVEDLEDARREAGHVLGALDGERLGDELAHHDVEARDHAEADAARDGLDEVLGDVQEFEQRAEDPRERGLSQPAEAQRREGDAQLRGGEELVEALLKTQGARRGLRHPPSPAPRGTWRALSPARTLPRRRSRWRAHRRAQRSAGARASPRLVSLVASRCPTSRRFFRSFRPIPALKGRVVQGKGDRWKGGWWEGHHCL